MGPSALSSTRESGGGGGGSSSERRQGCWGTNEWQQQLLIPGERSSATGSSPMVTTTTMHQYVPELLRLQRIPSAAEMGLAQDGSSARKMKRRPVPVVIPDEADTEMEGVCSCFMTGSRVHLSGSDTALELLHLAAVPPPLGDPTSSAAAGGGGGGETEDLEGGGVSPAASAVSDPSSDDSGAAGRSRLSLGDGGTPAPQEDGVTTHAPVNSCKLGKTSDVSAPNSHSQQGITDKLQGTRRPQDQVTTDSPIKELDAATSFSFISKSIGVFMRKSAGEYDWAETGGWSMQA
jgi:hypothetical protein